MDYALAKKLKDAGFPQARYKADVYFYANGSVAGYQRDFKAGEIKIPALSELIETCGEGFRMLERHPATGRWLTHKAHDIESWSTQLERQEQFDSPEEAVAKLWLALHGH